MDIKDILIEIEAMQAECEEYRYWADGLWTTEREMRKLENREIVKIQTRLQNSLESQTEQCSLLGILLSKEEKLAKEQLDAKTTLEQSQEDLDEKSTAARMQRSANRDQIHELSSKLSNLKQRNKENKENLDALEKSNADLAEKNGMLDAENKKLDTEIILLVQRVEVNNLLQEVDIEDMKMIAKNTNEMNAEFIKMMTRWETIKKSAEEKIVLVSKAE